MKISSVYRDHLTIECWGRVGERQHGGRDGALVRGSPSVPSVALRSTDPTNCTNLISKWQIQRAVTGGFASGSGPQCGGSGSRSWWRISGPQGVKGDILDE